MKHHQRTIGISDEWLTPPRILGPLGEFDLDPCAPINRPWGTARHHYTIEDDGLAADWFGRVWCNPPFSRYERPQWMRRMADHGDGILLVPAAMETKPFAESVWGRAHGVLVLHGRPYFHRIDGTRASSNSGCTICLVAYGERNGETLRGSGLGCYLREATE